MIKKMSNQVGGLGCSEQGFSSFHKRLVVNLWIIHFSLKFNSIYAQQTVQWSSHFFLEWGMKQCLTNYIYYIQGGCCPSCEKCSLFLRRRCWSLPAVRMIGTAHCRVALACGLLEGLQLVTTRCQHPCGCKRTGCCVRQPAEVQVSCSACYRGCRSMLKPWSPVSLQVQMNGSWQGESRFSAVTHCSALQPSVFVSVSGNTRQIFVKNSHGHENEARGVGW